MTEQRYLNKENEMDKFAVWSYMKVKPGKEQEVEEFLKYANL